MQKLFLHHPLFRLLSPLFSGVIVYLLLLLINNNVEQLYEQFLSEELYVCIGLSFIIQELSRLLLVNFKKFTENLPIVYALIIQLLASLTICILVVTIAINLYYAKILGYTLNSEELWVFNSIFSVITLVYILLFVSHYYLHKVNTQKLQDELEKKQMIEADFIAFKNSINPSLLFDSLEALITIIKQKQPYVDDLIDNMATTYRYLLTNSKKQLVSINNETEALMQLEQLMAYLPYSKVKVINQLQSDFLVVPGSLLKLVEVLVKKSITNTNNELKVELKDEDANYIISYNHNDKIITPFSNIDIENIKRVYGIYSNIPISIETDETLRQIHIPKLKLNDV